MDKSFRQLIKEYFSFSKKDRRGVLFLSTLIILVILATVVVDNIQLKSENDFSEFKKAIDAWEDKTENKTNYYSLFNFNPNTITEKKIDSLLLPRFVKKNILNYRKAGGKFDEPNDLRKIYGMNDSIYASVEKYITIPRPKNQQNNNEEKTKKIVSVPGSYTGSFNPNTADSATLVKFGFNSFQASNLIKYRQSGGSFSSPSEVLTIYGVDSTFYLTIEKHIKIEAPERIEPEKNNENIHVSEINIELNSADSTELIKLRGVGSVFASRIIKYRKLLGGFCATEQLLEVYNFPEETYQQIKQDIYVDQDKIQQIRLNFADYGDLMRHPYLDKEHVTAILDYRNKKGAFQSIKQLEDSGIIDSEKVKNLEPYISCR